MKPPIEINPNPEFVLAKSRPFARCSESPKDDLIFVDARWPWVYKKFCQQITDDPSTKS